MSNRYGVVGGTFAAGKVPVAQSDGSVIWGDGVRRSLTTLTDGATITWTITMSDSIATVTLGGNRTLAISSAAAGDCGILIVKQDGTGSRTLALPSGSKVRDAGTGAITLSTAASAIDVLGWVYDGTNYWWSYALDHT